MRADTRDSSGLRLIAVVAILCLFQVGHASADPLPSWRDGAGKAAILEFVAAVTAEGGPDFVAPAERVAVFDNDGTLWVEQPYYAQLQFALDRVGILAPEHPEWKTDQPFKAVLENDTGALLAAGERGLLDLLMATHAGNTTDEFAALVADWISRARHGRFDRRFTELVYQPMLEALRLLEENGFQSFIVSGGGIEFMRPWVEHVYGLPRERVIGSSIVTEFRVRDGKPVLVRLPQVDFIDDKAGKPVAIQKFIGRRPIAVFGNSDGDLQMLQWGTSGNGRRLGVIVHHDDAGREYSYDRDSHVGRLDKALDAAGPANWLVVSMRRDWERVFPWE
ncbi:haloacid dehalogenase-like hydrolase (plasmid) [Skermanella rosea]|uniref:HAD family hydrolase n=1 Tax=Skermanella rosea TaxID=1817965 RepID=UPI001933B976|nr:HAD family hydrolase [Skermanella rosea]UEM07431.1 haloacid dehalogenase-like hydrolase [Skermanella rosea]